MYSEPQKVGTWAYDDCCMNFPTHYLKGMRIMMFQLSGFFCRVLGLLGFGDFLLGGFGGVTSNEERLRDLRRDGLQFCQASADGNNCLIDSKTIALAAQELFPRDN